MNRTTWAAALVVLASSHLTVRPARGEISAEDARRAIERGVSYLLSRQDKVQGSWTEQPGYPGGVTALCTLALLNCGVPASDPAIQLALDYLRKFDKPEMTYSAALRTMVFCAAEPQQDRLLIRRHVAWLESSQVKEGPDNGGWSYGQRQGQADNSNSQFALLALHEAERVGVEVNDSTWRRALRYWLDGQRDDGSWGYRGGAPSTGSMTCAGIASVVIATGGIAQGDARVEHDRVLCCGARDEEDAAERGLDWLGRNFSVHSNPSSLGRRHPAFSQQWVLYYLYGVERVGRMTGRRFIGAHDWYREGAEMLVSQQDALSGYWKGTGHVENTPHVATALSLLFLSKGRRPVLIAKLKRSPAEDWDRHRGALAQLTRFVERRWQKDLTWQTIDVRQASVQDLLHAPVLFLSGRESLEFTPEQQGHLREYIHQGGFLFVEACCGGERFDRSFRQLMQELFPESPLRLLPPDHPVWYAEAQVDPRFVRPLFGVDACCRTSIVYCPQDLSCYWQLAEGERETAYPQGVREEIAACQAIGANVLAYATSRELREKLDLPQLIPATPDEPPPRRGTFALAKLRHGGGSDDAALAVSNLVQIAGQQLQLPVSSDRRLLAATDADLVEYPVLYLHGRRAFRFSAAERAALAAYLENGGVVLADAICASRPFADALRRELAAILPGRELKRVPASHPLFTPAYRGFDVTRVRVRRPGVRARAADPLRARLEQTAPWLEGIEVDGRYVVLFSPLDISCGLESHASLDCEGYVREDAARLGVNMIVYAMQQ